MSISLLKRKILSLDDNPKLIDQLDEIGKILNEHIRKEERVLFEKAQTILNDEELKMIENKFDESRPQTKSCIIKANNKQL
jgi:hemerythrin-like domain-containing protein